MQICRMLDLGEQVIDLQTIIPWDADTVQVDSDPGEVRTKEGDSLLQCRIRVWGLMQFPGVVGVKLGGGITAQPRCRKFCAELSCR